MSDKLSSSENLSYSAEYLQDSETDDSTHDNSEANCHCCEMCGIQIQGDVFSNSGNFHPHPSAFPQSSQLVVPGHRELFNDQDHYHPLVQRLNFPPAPSLPIQEESFDSRRSVLVTGVQPGRVQEHLHGRYLQELQDRPPLAQTVQQEQTPLGGGVRAEVVVSSHVPLSSYQGALLLTLALRQTSFGVGERAELVLSSHVPLGLSRPQRAQILTIRNEENRRQLLRNVPESQVPPLQQSIELVHNSFGTFSLQISGVSELIRIKNMLYSPQFHTANGYMLKASIQVVPMRDPTEECVQFVVRITHKGNPLERPTRLQCCLLDQSASELKQNVVAVLASLTENSTLGHFVFEFKVVVQDRELLNASYIKDNKMSICFKIG